VLLLLKITAYYPTRAMISTFLTFFPNFSEIEMAEIGYDLIKNGQKYRKENKGKWIEMETSQKKTIEVYFAHENDEKGAHFLTHGRCAIVTARATSKILANNNDMPAFGLNVGWQSTCTDANLAVINNLLTKQKLEMISKESLIMISIPKVKPHPILNLTQSEANLMICFHIINDAYNTSKRKALVLVKLQNDGSVGVEQSTPYKKSRDSVSYSIIES
jgi:hypothetical protein